MDSDEFLWDPASPLNRTADGRVIEMGAMRLAPEASAIIGATLMDRPVEVAVAMARNALRQAMMPRVGDTLDNTHLDASARRAIAAMPARELAAFDAGAQMRGELRARAAPVLPVQVPVLLAALPLLLAAMGLAGWRGDRVRFGILSGVLVALAANAFATGALSAPVDRYQARIVWLLPLMAMLGLLPRFDAGLSVDERVRARIATWSRSSSSS
jgi:hypothetical protein